MTGFLPATMLALYHPHRRFFGGIVLLVLVVVLIALGIVLIVRLVRTPKRSVAEPPIGRFSPPPPPVDPVLSELRLRYARGEISREEYLQRAGDLGYHSEESAAPPPWPSSPGGYPSPPGPGVSGS